MKNLTARSPIKDEFVKSHIHAPALNTCKDIFVYCVEKKKTICEKSEKHANHKIYDNHRRYNLR